MNETTKPDKNRQIPIEQANAIEHLLSGQSDRAVAEAVGVSRQTVCDWRNNDPFFIAELNRQRVALWREARERLKSLANRALDVVELQLGSSEPKAALAAAKYILQGTRLLGDTDLLIKGPTNPEEIILGRLRRKARQELTAKEGPTEPIFEFDQMMDPRMYDSITAEKKFADRVETLAKSRLKKAMAEARPRSDMAVSIIKAP
jgi:hypothetical protein